MDIVLPILTDIPCRLDSSCMTHGMLDFTCMNTIHESVGPDIRPTVYSPDLCATYALCTCACVVSNCNSSHAITESQTIQTGLGSLGSSHRE